MALRRMDNVGIVVESLDAAIAFFAELGLEFCVLLVGFGEGRFLMRDATAQGVSPYEAADCAQDRNGDCGQKSTAV